LFFPAIQEELRILSGLRPAPAALPDPVLDLGPPVYTSTPAPVEIEVLEATPSPALSALPSEASPAAPAHAIAASSIQEALEAAAPAREEPVVAPPPRAEPPPVPVVRTLEAPKPIVTLGSLTPPPVAPP